MKRYVEIEPICPFVGKACIKDGWEWNGHIFRPCAFYDESVMCREYPDEPCRIKRAVNRILADEKDDDVPTVVDVPFPVDERTDCNAKKTKG